MSLCAAAAVCIAGPAKHAHPLEVVKVAEAVLGPPSTRVLRTERLAQLPDPPRHREKDGSMPLVDAL